MDHLDLLTKMRASLVLVTLTMRLSGDKDQTIEEKHRSGIVDLQKNIKYHFDVASMPFGRRRAIPAEMLPTLVTTAGKLLGDLKARIGALSEVQQQGFGVTIEYEPVPDGAGFIMLPEQFAKGLSGAVDRRAMIHFEEGFDRAFFDLYGAAKHFVARVDVYDNNAGSGEKRNIFRAATLTNLVEAGKLVQHANLDGLRAAYEVTAALKALDGVTSDVLRKDEAARKRALAAVVTAVGVMREYYSEDEPADGQE